MCRSVIAPFNVATRKSNSGQRGDERRRVNVEHAAALSDVVAASLPRCLFLLLSNYVT